MSHAALSRTDDGLEVLELATNKAFAARPVRPHDAVREMEGMRHIARAFVDRPETILQELVNAAVEFCGADSAGISIEREGGTDEQFYHWVATAGEYTAFLDAVLPRWPSACGVTLERGSTQNFRVGARFFEIMGITAPLVTDGLLLPWQADNVRGTIFVMAHGRTSAFDANDARLMALLADFAALGVRQQRQQKAVLQQAKAAAAASMANQLAHRINNPLQSLTNLLYLAAEGYHGEEAREIGRQTLDDLQNLSSLVAKLLALPYREASSV